eukprot:CAMPEP_0170535236 /NCGR_PEP_ID=MMETSP0209-20121228/98523_1 /TAXON_ID=665100 ORGANISM="Litonotus pictus, Strain P1" /NCGR_SAMPLE_ID=MMETSP0209 /ASSEMBLY_ACC=CAM_ASM_000301 /LENGTH=82 /DNA_ID=CAMNT_0010835893 /DNA_START=364 /DNA_END=609 /DNA_ORIENTATION=-
MPLSTTDTTEFLFGNRTDIDFLNISSKNTSQYKEDGSLLDESTLEKTKSMSMVFTGFIEDDSSDEERSQSMLSLNNLIYIMG